MKDNKTMSVPEIVNGLRHIKTDDPYGCVICRNAADAIEELLADAEARKRARKATAEENAWRWNAGMRKAAELIPTLKHSDFRYLIRPGHAAGLSLFIESDMGTDLGSITARTEINTWLYRLGNASTVLVYKDGKVTRS